jgi:hypothetical protein
MRRTSLRPNARAAAMSSSSPGTSSVVYPAAGLARTARSRGAFVIEINLDVTPLSALADVSIRGSAEIVLDGLETALQRGTWNLERGTWNVYLPLSPGLVVPS